MAITNRENQSIKSADHSQQCVLERFTQMLDLLNKPQSARLVSQVLAY